MAESILLDSNIRLVYDAGVDSNGEIIEKRKSYTNIQPKATNENILIAAQAIASLCSLPLLTVERTDLTEIAE